MPVTQEENQSYGKFVHEVGSELGIFDLQNDAVLWHYTNGNGLLGILQSGLIHATQVSALNDSRETKYGTDLYKKAIEDLLVESTSETATVSFLKQVLQFVTDEPEYPWQAISKFYVACFSAAKDDLNQWLRYAGRGQGRYAIGFRADGLTREPNSSLFRVVYDKQKLESAVKRIAEATIFFYKQGLTGQRVSDPDTWASEFFGAWDEWIYKLAPLAKEPAWQSENEYRIVHELKLADRSKVRFAQKATMLSRYIPLDFPCSIEERVSRLPIATLIIGPQPHPQLTKVSARLLLEQMGYADVPVELSNCAFIDR